MTQITTNPAAELVEELNEEELLAQFHEGAAPITDEQLALVERYRALNKEKHVIEAEQKAIKELILEEMDQLGVNKLTRRGVVEVQDVHFLADEWDKKAILMHFPGVTRFIRKVARTRFDPKK
jgi:hypothetical protein